MSDYKVYWDNICKIYFLTKHYLLLCEEYSDEFDTFLQPVKEHRDAFDHIARVYGYEMLDRKVVDIDEYRNGNMRKAVGHTYRAFFDTADWLSYICRKQIRELLSNYKKDEIIAKCPEYEEIKKLLTEIPEQISHIRENKDLSDKESELIQEVDKYRKLLDRIIDARKKIFLVFG